MLYNIDIIGYNPNGTGLIHVNTGIKLLNAVVFVLLFSLEVNASDLQKACRKGDLQTVKSILKEKPALLNCSDLGNVPPLLAAVYGQNLAVVKHLVTSGANVNQVDDIHGLSPVIVAAQQGNMNILKYLHSKGSDLNYISKLRFTALHAASDSGHIDIVKFLISKAVPLEIHDTAGGFTPLHYACDSRKRNIVDFLLKSGANPNARNKSNQTCIELCKKRVAVINKAKDYSYKKHDTKTYFEIITLLEKNIER